MNKQLITKAVTVHFACDKRTLQCSGTLEDYVGVATDFINFMLTGNTTPQLARVLKTKRYKTKMHLIETYIKQNEK